MLASYLTNTKNLLQNPGAPQTLYSDSDLTNYINIARGQIAGESEGIRVVGTIQTIIGQQSYNFSDMILGTPTRLGVQGIINIRWIMYNVGAGQKWVKNKSWEWFSYQRYNNPVPNSGPPTEWTQHRQGTSGTGSITGAGGGALATGNFWIDPLPDLAYMLQCDCVCYPIALASDTDPEALPYFWTDAVPYFAAYLALMSAQTGQRMQQAQQMFQIYEQFVQRARAFSNPAITRHLYEQAQNPTMQNKLALGGGGGAQ